MPQLKILKAANNELATLPTRVGEKCALEYVDIHGNQITSLPAQLLFRATRSDQISCHQPYAVASLLPFPCTQTCRLQVLNISSNKLSSLPILSPEDEGRSLLQLYASDNQLEPGLNIIAG